MRIGVLNLLPRLGACGGPKGGTFAVRRSHSAKRLYGQDVHVPTLRIGILTVLRCANRSPSRLAC
jgi:hypothetical protein